VNWIRANLAKLVVIVAVILIVGGLLFLRSCETARTAKTAEKLATGQRGAAIESGADAVQSTGNVSATETARLSTVKEGTDAIHEAPAGDSNDPADRAACRLRSYRHSDKCVALLGPVAE
jgi:hypothetical protein